MESLRFSRVEFSAVLLWLLVVVQVDAHNQSYEVVALTSFKNALKHIDINNSLVPYWFTWKETDENACEWVGVTCSPNYTVEALDFSNWGLYTISSFTPLSNLPDLRQLDMSYNNIFGPDHGIPDDIGSLTQLSRLDLSYNRFEGSIPSNISACRNLQFLSLKNNHIQGTIPDMSDLVLLQFLLLADNQLSGSFPSELGNMSSLVTIDISGNMLHGTIPSLLNATNLRYLSLDRNYIVGFEEPIQINAPNLQTLYVSDNLLDGVLPLTLIDLKDLVNLDLSFNSLSGTIPSGLYHESDLEFILDLSHNQLSGSIPADLLETVPYLVHISLSYNFLNGSFPTVSVNYTSTNYTTTRYSAHLDLSHNQLSGPVPRFIFSVIGSAYLNHNFLSGDIVDVLTLAGGPSSVELRLGSNYLTGDLSRIAFQWTNWTYLEVLDLSNNNLSWRASESISDPVSAVIFSMPISLTKVYLGGNNFSGTSLPITPVFEANGSPPLQANGSLSLSILDLSNCQLEGGISGAVFNGGWMRQLQSLNLSHNSATGPVPENMTNLPSLQILDLSYNDLSGPLPQSLPQNSYLINTSFFVGNDELCGYPLKPCPQVFPSHRTGVLWWVLLTTIGGSLMIATGSCCIVTWRWRVYRKLHEQDADLIKTLMDREMVTLMPLWNLKKATNNFAESEQIGEGGFGTVYRGTLNDGTKVAIKRSKSEGSGKDKQQFLNEVRILSQVNHRHLVKLMGCCMENKVALLVFEFISNGTLEDHLRGKAGDGHLTWKHRLNIAVQTADALNYLHSATTSPIYHRDVKSANILLTDDLSAKVADFGISKVAPTMPASVVTTLRGTPGYMDPESLVSFQMTEKSDVYSFGVVLLELISARPARHLERGKPETKLVDIAYPYLQSGNMEPLIDPTLRGTYDEQSGHGKKSILDVGRLAMRCLEMQSIARPTMNEVLKELQDVLVKFDETFIEKSWGTLDNDDYSECPLPYIDHQILLSQAALANKSDSDSLNQSNDRSLELSSFSHVSSSS